MPSSVIRYFTYDDRNCELTVHFVSGRRYVYLRVPASIYAAFRTAPSKGTFFNARIRDRFTCRELEPTR